MEFPDKVWLEDKGKGTMIPKPSKPRSDPKSVVVIRNGDKVKNSKSYNTKKQIYLA